MTFDEFQELVEEKILVYLPDAYENAEVQTFYMNSLNGSFHALQVNGGKAGYCPAINIEKYYEEYQTGKTVDEVLHEMAGVVVENRRMVDVDVMKDYEKASKRLFIRVSSVIRNLAFLKRVPHRIVDDLVLTYHVAIDLSPEEFGSGVITYDVMQMYGVTEEQLYYDAMRSCPDVLGASVQSLDEVLFHGPAPFDDCGAAREIRIVTGSKAKFGAAILFCPDMMRDIAQEMQSSYFVIPSSIHEVMLIPTDDPSDYERLEGIVHSVNASCVKWRDLLSDHVYYYDAEIDMFSRADRFVELQKEAEDLLGQNV